ncbi:MAG: hypothetical protein MI923_26810 [Phycisphaerales bacterium]|nr:hypothetical protein [Phycisphaerales bacterium]
MRLQSAWMNPCLPSVDGGGDDHHKPFFLPSKDAGSVSALLFFATVGVSYGLDKEFVLSMIDLRCAELPAIFVMTVSLTRRFSSRCWRRSPTVGPTVKAPGRTLLTDWPLPIRA